MKYLNLFPWDRVVFLLSYINYNDRRKTQGVFHDT